ncbi:MAG: phage shock envelope stress response protein PspM [Frankia sp.]
MTLFEWVGAGRMPDWIRADVDRRLLVHTEWRARRTASRPRRRALASARAWSTVAVGCVPVAAIERTWTWAVVGGLAAARGGLSWRDARRAGAAESAGLTMPTVTGPPPGALRRSAAAEPLRRGESALMALGAAVRTLPAGPVADQGRAAMATGVSIVDELRGQAHRVLACEAAARAGVDPAHRDSARARARAVAAEMASNAAHLDELLAAAGEVIEALPGCGLHPDHLRMQTETLRGTAAALRDLARRPDPGR